MVVGEDSGLLQSLPDGVLAFAIDSQEILVANDTLRETLGYTNSELVGSSVSSLVVDREGGAPKPPRLDDRIQRARTGDSVEFTMWLRTADDRIVAFDAHLRVTAVDDSPVALASLRPSDDAEVQDPASASTEKPTAAKTDNRSEPIDHQDGLSPGDAGGGTTSGPDESGPTAAKDEPEAREGRPRRALDYLPDYVLIVDEAGTIRYCSSAVGDILGRDPEELTGIDAFGPVHPDDEPETRASFEKLLKNPSTELSVEYRVITGDGDTTWVEARGRNYLDSPLIEGVLVTVRDISTRKAYERRIETQNRMLERLASIVSHDLKTPISAASKLVEVLRGRRESGDAEDTEIVDNLETVLDDLRRFADHLPKLAQEGTGVEDPIECDLADIARSAWNGVDTESLSLEFDGTRTLEGDRRRLQRAFQNLFENAMTHATDASVVTVGTTPGGFYVEDDGSGIEFSGDGDIFEYGISGGDGSGMGLAIVRTIVEAHGWSVTVAESDDRGARFEVKTSPT